MRQIFNVMLIFAAIILAYFLGYKEIGWGKKSWNNGLITYEDIIVFPEPDGLTELQINTLGRTLPASKEDGALPVTLTLTAGGVTLDTYGKIKVQGTSTSRWPKKNWKLSFYADAGRSQKLRLKIGDSIASDEWISKAEWLDPTLLRNALSYRLWEAMVKSRKNFPQNEVDLAWAGCRNMYEGVQTGSAQGFPKVHPILVKINSEYYGICILLLGHDPGNFNINKDNPKHIYMEFDARGGYTSIKTWDKFSAAGIGQWINGYHPQNEEFSVEQRAAVDALGGLINGSQDDFVKNFDRYLDKTNMIDMLLFIEAIYDWDAVSQDIEMVTYDLEKWYMLPWDKDTTFGIYWDGSGVIDNSESKLVIEYQSENPTQKPWYRTYHAFTTEVEARYAQLRDEDIFCAHALYILAGDIIKNIPKEMWEAERARWEGDKRPSLDETSVFQVISWFEKRLETLDEQFNYVP